MELLCISWSRGLSDKTELSCRSWYCNNLKSFLNVPCHTECSKVHAEELLGGSSSNVTPNAAVKIKGALVAVSL